MIDAIFFDGKSARAHPVKIAIQQDYLTIMHGDGSVHRQPLANTRVDESFQGAAQRIELGGGALLEVKDKTALQQSLDQAGQKLGLVQTAQNSWRWVLGGVAALVGLMALAYFVLIPLGAKHLTAWLPESVDRTIGDQAWPLIEQQMFKPSKLSSERQQVIAKTFTALTSQLPDSPNYRLEFRASSIGPNAIAVPGGRLVMTDELAALTIDDNAIMGVLLHELGHIKLRHSMRNIVQATAVSAVLSAWLGDVSSIVAMIPASLATMKYSRDLETEADDFAIAALKRLGIAGAPTADLFVALEKAQGAKRGSGGDGSGASESIFSSHPVTSERIRKLRELK